MFTSVTAAVSAAALVAILAGIATLLVRASRWPDPTPPSRHGLAAHPDGVRPRPWDEVTAETPLGEAYVMLPLPPVEDDESEPEPAAELEEVAPISAPPVAGPVDELDPRWDWMAYAKEQDERYAAWETPEAVARMVADRELVDA